LFMAALSGGAGAVTESLPATKPVGLDESFRKSQENRPHLYDIHSAALDAALKKPAELLQFITAPETAYADRRAAAMQGAKSIPLEQMPTVLRERDEMNAEAAADSWGLQPDPRLELFRIVVTQPKAQTLTVLGHRWNLPAKYSPYPLSWDEEAHAPWPWQVQMALNDLFYYMAPTIFRDDQATCARWLDVAMTMPCENDAQAMQFVEATQAMTHFSTMAVMSRWRRIACNPNMPRAASRIANGIGDYVRLWQDDRAQGLVQLVILSLMKRPEPDPRGAMDYRLDSMREQTQWLRTPGDSVIKRLPVPATSVLALCQRCINAKTDDWTRLYGCILPVCQTVDDPPFDPAPIGRMDSKSPNVPQLIGAFDTWFTKVRPKLESEATGETASLDRLRLESDADAARYEVTTRP
jgi:hypothetical protein